MVFAHFEFWKVPFYWKTGILLLSNRLSSSKMWTGYLKILLIRNFKICVTDTL